MILADAINLPLLLFYGGLTIVPLTLVVVVLELWVLRCICHIPGDVSFTVILKANVLSTLAGWIVYLFQDVVLWYVGIETLLDCVRFYLWGAVLLIGIYYLKSVLVEGLFIARRKYAAAGGIGRGRLWRSVMLANAASYLIVGPLFYFSTRPSLGDLTITDDPASIANYDDTVYFLQAGSEHVCRIRATGEGFQDVVPYRVKDFLVSEDQTAFAYRGEDGNLYFYRIGDAAPTLVRQADERRYHMTSVDISKDKSKIAYGTSTRVTVFDVSAKREIASVCFRGEHEHLDRFLLAWDAQEPTALHYRSGQTSLAWTVTPSQMTPITKSPEALVGNYRRWPGMSWGSQDDWGVSPGYFQEQGEFMLRPMQGLYSSVWVGKGSERLVSFQEDYGLIGLSFRGPREASFLSAPGVVLCEGGQCLYVLNSLQKKVALLARGYNHLIVNTRFQAPCGDETR